MLSEWAVHFDRLRLRPQNQPEQKEDSEAKGEHDVRVNLTTTIAGASGGRCGVAAVHSDLLHGQLLAALVKTKTRNHNATVLRNEN